jgi:hypothetical protein
MICRRCGMESATTDVCEWCKKPMLPEGGSISAKAKEKLREERVQAEKQGPPQEAQAEPPRPPAEGEMTPARPGLKPPRQPEVHESGLRSLGSHIGEEAAEATPPTFETRELEQNDTPLRPLGPGLGGQGERPSELSAETTRYIGDEQSIFRPIERPRAQGTGQWVVDPATGRRRRVMQEKVVIADNVRLKRAAPQGAVVAVVVTLAQFFIAHAVPSTIATVKFPGLASTSNPSIINALVYAIYLSILLGFMLAAMLVQFRKGPGVGFLIGLAIGFLVLQNSYWGIAAGVLAGLLVGRVTGKGIRTVVSV